MSDESQSTNHIDTSKSAGVKNQPFNPRLLEAISLQKNTKAKAILTKDMCKITNNRGRTLLHWAARHRNAAIARHLIKLGSDVNHVDAKFTTPLMVAVKKRCAATVKVLLEANANYEYTRNNGAFNALDMAICISDTAVNRVFFQHLRKLTRTTDEYVKKMLEAGCCLYSAIHLRDMVLMKGLIEMGLHINSDGTKSRTALHAAVRYSYLNLVKWLIDRNACVHALDEKNLAPVHFVYRRGHKQTIERLEILQLLIDQSVDLMECSSYGYPQITSILKYGSEQAICKLLPLGIDFNAQFGRYNKSLLHLLVENLSPGVVEALEDVKDLNVNALDGLRRCPLYVAVMYGNTAVVEFLLRRGADPNNQAGTIHKYNLFLSTFANRSYRPRSQQSMDDCALLLLQHGANPQISRAIVNRIFEHADKYKIDLVLARLAMMEMLGTTIEKHTHFLIKLDPRTQIYYQSCQIILGTQIFESLTLLDLLNETDSMMKIHLHDKLFIDKIRRIGCKYQLREDYSYYYETLKRRITKLSYDMRLEYEAAKTLKQIFNGYHMDHCVVVQLIIPYFNKRDLKLLVDWL